MKSLLHDLFSALRPALYKLHWSQVVCFLRYGENYYDLWLLIVLTRDLNCTKLLVFPVDLGEAGMDLLIKECISTLLNLHTVSSAGSEVTDPAALFTIQQYVASSSDFVTPEIVRVLDVASEMLVLFFCH